MQYCKMLKSLLFCWNFLIISCDVYGENENTIEQQQQRKRYNSDPHYHRRKRHPAIQEMNRMVVSRPEHLPKIDYGDSHPFDLYQSAQENAVLDILEDNSIDQNNHQERNLEDSRRNPENFYPIRIEYDFSNLHSRGTPEDEIRIKAIKEEALPYIASYYNSMLSVIRNRGKIPISNDECFGYLDIPSKISTKGVYGMDLYVFVAGFQSVSETQLCGDDFGVLAAAAPCGLDQFDRPITGFINFCLDEIPVRNGQISHENMNDLESIAIHEFAHVLGINSDSWKFFRHPITGIALTPRPFKKSVFTCVAGKKFRDIAIPSCKVLSSGVASNGMPYFEIVTPTVTQVARNQFGCQTLTGARLENQPTNPFDCFGTHWDERYFYAETLSAYYAPEADYFSALTLALLEDSGWYMANFRHAEVSPFGHGAGCDFVEKNCIERTNIHRSKIGGVVPDYARGFFCAEPMTVKKNNEHEFIYKCDPSHTHKAGCDLVNRGEAHRLPKEGRYFGNKDYGTLIMQNADYCPIAAIDSRDCTNINNSNRWGEDLPGEEYGPQSMCYEAKLPIGGETMRTSLCFKSRCNAETMNLEVLIAGNVLRCQNDFQTLGFTYLGQNVIFTCPRLTVACPRLFCPANCSGKGVCNYAADTPRCECFDPKDKSDICNMTQIKAPEEGRCSSGVLRFSLNEFTVIAIYLTGLFILI